MTLVTECRDGVRHEGDGYTVFFKEESGQCVRAEIPGHSLRKAGNRRCDPLCQPHRDVISGEDILVHVGEHTGFMLPDPVEFRGCEIAGGIQERAEAAFVSEPVERSSPDAGRAAVAPYDGRAEDVSSGSHDHKTMHLV